MKNFIYSVLIVIFSLSFGSCKKNDYHKVTFEVTFLGSPSTGVSNMIDVQLLPKYSDNPPSIDRFNVPQVWRYDYIGLEKGQFVEFVVRAQLSYHFEMRVFIDGVQVSYRKVKVSDTSYYDDHVEDSNGLNDKSNEDTGEIQFTYR